VDGIAGHEGRGNRMDAHMLEVAFKVSTYAVVPALHVHRLSGPV
jgi:hypothetical protein